MRKSHKILLVSVAIGALFWTTGNVAFAVIQLMVFSAGFFLLAKGE
jgi:hypothetical protein